MSVSSNDVHKPPPIEHITQNYFPLKSIILSVTDRCGKELANVLRTTESLPTDAARKEQFLKFVVACRQEYVKLYVLCKWAVVSEDISRSIDVANWLHGQINCFNNVVGALYNLQSSLGSAKSPWADLDTALEVLNLGHPLPPQEVESLLPESPMQDNDVLKLLKRLDVLIALRLALHEQIPLHYRNYAVHNGRARFHLGNGMIWVEFSIADEVVETATRFFYVDCGFEEKDTELDAKLRLKLEAAVNQQLAQCGLVEVLDWISYVAALYKLQLLEKQLQGIEKGASPWAGVISHRFTATSLTMLYFLDSTEPGEIQLSLADSAPYELTISKPIGVDVNGEIHGLANRILVETTKLHATRLMTKISAPFITAKTDFSVSLELSPYKFTDLSIDKTSGKFALAGQTLSIKAAQKALNDGQDPVTVLNELRTQTLMDTLATRAEASGWQTRRNLRLNSDVLSKIAPHTSLLALRLPTGSDWSLCIALGGSSTAGKTTDVEPRWFACRLISVQGRWTIQSINDIAVDVNIVDPDYAFFTKLIGEHHRHITLLELLRELECSNTNFAVKRKTHTTSIVIDLPTILAESSKWAHSGLLLTGDASSQVSLEGRALKGKLATLGDFEEPVGKATLSVNGATGAFKIVTSEGQDTLAALVEALKQLHHTALSLAAAASLGIQVKSISLKNMEFLYAEPNGRIFVQYGRQITFADDNPQQILSPFLPAITEYSHDSLYDTVIFLRHSYPVYELLRQLETQLRLMILPRSMNQIRIHVGSGVETPFLDVTLRDFRRRAFVHYITAGNEAEKNPTILEFFRTKTEGSVPLVAGCAVQLDSIRVITPMLKALSKSW